MDPVCAIAACRDLLGPPERDLGRLGWRKFRTRQPLWSWLDPADDIRMYFQYLQRTFVHGHVVWGHIVQANEDLFKRGRSNAPADVVFNFDPACDGEVGHLEALASALFDLKGTRPADPALRHTADKLTDEYARDYGVPVPAPFAGYPGYLMSVTYIDRRHLPAGRLCEGLLPLLVHPRSPHVAAVVPSRFWDADFVEWWLESEA
jgi:hypothetical protein